MRTIIARRGLNGRSPIELSHRVIERMGDDAHGADDLGNVQRRLEGVLHQVGGVALPLIVPVDRQLSDEPCRDRIGAIAPLRLWQISPARFARRSRRRNR